MKIGALLLLMTVFALLLVQATGALATHRVIEGGPAPLSATRSLARAIDDAHSSRQTLHILFVHGIRADRDGTSSVFAVHLAQALGGTLSEPMRIGLPLDWPRSATMASFVDGNGTPTPIWPTAEIWKRSEPFLNRATISSASGQVVIDEVNYWPLLLPLKCRALLVPEQDLAGADAKHLQRCHEEGWISKQDLDRLLRTKARSGRGSLLNRKLKQEMMDWGLSDAVIALGPMRRYLNDTIEQACALALQSGSDDRYVVISESLGSFVVMDAFAERRESVGKVLQRTADLYFFANQFALLELARIKGIDIHANAVGAQAVAAATPSPLQALATWGTSPAPITPQAIPGQARPGIEKQIVAFSDPSDILTFNVPAIAGVNVVNLYDRQGFDLLGIVADPVAAHTGHSKNEAVWRILLRR